METEIPQHVAAKALLACRVLVGGRLPLKNALAVAREALHLAAPSPQSVKLTAALDQRVQTYLDWWDSLNAAQQLAVVNTCNIFIQTAAEQPPTSAGLMIAPVLMIGLDAVARRNMEKESE